MKRFRLPLPLLVLLLSCPLLLPAQARYANPVLHADYSDPDVCRVGEDYYMTASSFNCFPGLPILHSRDLVHWELAGAALSDYPGPDWYGPDADFHGRVQHGNGVWAPAIRYHDGWFYIFCGDPDRGIFMVRTQDPRGRWEDPVWVVKAKGFIDPCPLWDEDGRAWLSHAAAGSRAGLKSVVFVAPMSPDGTRLLGPSRIVYDGHKTQPTIEGTKFYKRDGRYYIFAPAGGVKTGWQTVLRAESPYGPYEERIVMASAEGTINGPHQGGWVETAQGEHWFLHFQDKGAYGRIVHLQPMTWRSDGWPLIGEDPDGDGIGQPVASYRMPGVAMHPAGGPGGAAGSFDAERPRWRRKGSAARRNQDASTATGPYGLPLAWQYPAVPSPYWHHLLPDGTIRLYSVEQPYGTDWRQMPNLLLQKFPAENFTVVAKLQFHPHPDMQETAGFLVTGDDLAGYQLVAEADGVRLGHFTSRPVGKSADGGPVIEEEIDENVAFFPYDSSREVSLWVKLEVRAKPTGTPVPEAICRFGYSTDGRTFTRYAFDFKACPEQWIGAKFGFFCNRPVRKNDGGWLDVSELRIQ